MKRQAMTPHAAVARPITAIIGRTLNALLRVKGGELPEQNGFHHLQDGDRVSEAHEEVEITAVRSQGVEANGSHALQDRVVTHR